MKRITSLIIVLVVFATCHLHAQTSLCGKFKEGNYKTSNNGYTILIKRQGNIQTETLVEKKMTVQFVVKWINACAYTLTPTAESIRKYPTILKGTVLTIKITSVKNNSYRYSGSSTTSSEVFNGEIIKAD